MSTTFKVHWAGIAEEDLKNIVLYIADDSPTNARAIFEKIKEKLCFEVILESIGCI